MIEEFGMEEFLQHPVSHLGFKIDHPRFVHGKKPRNAPEQLTEDRRV